MLTLVVGVMMISGWHHYWQRSLDGKGQAEKNSTGRAAPQAPPCNLCFCLHQWPGATRQEDQEFG